MGSFANHGLKSIPFFGHALSTTCRLGGTDFRPLQTWGDPNNSSIGRQQAVFADLITRLALDASTGLTPINGPIGSVVPGVPDYDQKTSVARVKTGIKFHFVLRSWPFA